MRSRIFRDLIDSGANKGKPKCVVEGCNKPGHHTGQRRADGSVIYRAQCLKHHSIRYGIGDWEYKKYRKTYCENNDGRLGFVCTATILPDYSADMLDADHVNNNHNDNRKVNLQTLCANCHRVKTKLFGHLTNLNYIKKLFKNNTMMVDISKTNEV